jgi:DNA-binding IclR family transcriptional regulator
MNVTTAASHRDRTRRRDRVAHSAKAGRSVPAEILNVLQVLRARPAQTFPQIAEMTGLPEPVVDQWTRRLADWQLLEPAESRYRAGLVLRLTGDGSPANAPGLLPALSAVATDEVRLGVLHPGGVAYVEQRPGSAGPLTAAGTQSAADSALGHALLAFRSDHRVPSPAAQPRSGGVDSGGKLAHALAVTRLSGVAITRRRTRGRGFRVAVPVLASDGSAVLAVELPTGDLGDGFPSLLAALVAASRKVARDLERPDRRVVDDSAVPAQQRS